MTEKKRGRPRKYTRLPGGELIPNTKFRDRRNTRRQRRESELDKVDDGDPGREGVNVVDE